MYPVAFEVLFLHSSVAGYFITFSPRHWMNCPKKSEDLAAQDWSVTTVLVLFAPPSEADRGDCEQGCSNNIGSYTCFCGNGYTLNGDGLACDDVDECASSNTHNCYSDGHCTNTVGGYDCSCPTGFVLKVSVYLDKLTLESSYMSLRQVPIGCSLLCQEYNKLIGWYVIIMRRQLCTLTYSTPDDTSSSEHEQ